MSKTLTTEEFIEKAKTVHGEKYDYSKSIYINAISKIKIICLKHGLFEQNSYAHLRGQGCKKCRNEYYRNKYIFSKEKWVSLCKIKHLNKYDYSMVEYNGHRNNVKIICPKHGIFEQKAGNHACGYGCKDCQMDEQKWSLEEFIEKAKTVHGDKYDYSKTLYINNHEKIIIICKKHGEFLQQPNNHLFGQRCPHCKSSKGEEKIKYFLEKNNLKFKKEFRFVDCKDKRSLPFDFYLPDYNMCIEYDGEHHFFPRFYGVKRLKGVKRRDEIKNQYCNKNKIKIVRISYKDFLNIDNILIETFDLKKGK